MKLQSLAVIFIIIILPISIIISVYTQNQITTINLQTSYDSKLNDATYDAIKAFQINSFNDDTSDMVNSKLRDIQASVNTFYNSIATNFNMAGYNSDALKEYVPALVYTMYDGYYIYTPYIDSVSGNKEYGLKPYVYYSCRYKGVPLNDDDFVITYSLDNYITINGKVNGKFVDDAGYILTTGNIIEKDGNLTYRGINILPEDTLKENVLFYRDSQATPYSYKKINGVKYYCQGIHNDVFTVINGNKYVTTKYSSKNIIEDKDNSAVNFYKKAAEFTKRVLGAYNLGELKTSNAYINGEKIDGNQFIFKDENNDLEDSNSNFNQHRLAVIRKSIETNLSTAIANYNNYGNSTKANFQMPKLKEDEWDKLTNNIAIISFLQGLNIGGKIYNGYSIINNNNNTEVVAEDSIYIADGDSYYDISYEDINEKGKIGILNTDLKRRAVYNSDGTVKYFYPKQQYADYASVISRNSNVKVTNLKKYMNDHRDLAKLYYTALARERYSMYRVNNPFLENN